MRTAAAVLLFVHAGLLGLAGLFCVFGAVLMPFAMLAEGTSPGDPPIWFGAVFYGGVAVLALGLALMSLVGGLNAMKARSWGWALAGAICSVLGGMSCCNIIGLVLGIVALVFLCLPEVQREFEPRP